MSPFLTEIRPAPSALWDLWADAGRPRRLTTNLAGPTSGQGVRIDLSEEFASDR